MSQRLINLNPDLKQLQDEGYSLEIRASYLLIHDIPHLNSQKEVKYGTLVASLLWSGDKTIPPNVPPNNHVVHFIGEFPCRIDGSKIPGIELAQPQIQNIGDLTTNFSFSNKPDNGYSNYYDKMTRYIEIISNQAKAVDPNATAEKHRLIPSEERSVFKYMDSFSSRYGIDAATQKLALEKVAIIGLGGTGSYVLDLIAKTPIKEIHLFDADKFYQHNAFRSPGAASKAELDEQPYKVNYLEKIYSKMRDGIFPHAIHVTPENIEQLKVMNFVFICIDKGSIKKLLIDNLTEWSIPLIDVGMGINKTEDNSLLGIVRTTTGTPSKYDHFKTRVSFADDDGKNEYDTDIQIADLNALNATLAVIKWKKIFKFYVDQTNEHHCLYTVDGNQLTNDEKT